MKTVAFFFGHKKQVHFFQLAQTFSCLVLVMILLLTEACGGGAAQDLSLPCQPSALPGDLVITELMVNPKGSDKGNEWIEIYNASSVPQCLNGLTIKVAGTTTSDNHTIMSPDQIILEPGEYGVLGDGTQEWLMYSWGEGLMALPNSAGVITIYSGPDELDSIGYGSVVEEPDAPTPKEGYSLFLCSDICKQATCNNNPDAWRNGNELYDAENSGSPGVENPECECKPPPNFDTLVSPQIGDLIITEVFANPQGSDDKKMEWFEVRVVSQQALDLSGVGIVVKKGQEPKFIIGKDGGCVSAAPGDYIVFAGSDNPDANGGIENAISYKEKFSLYNSNGYIGLVVDGAVIAEVEYEKAPTNASWQLDEEGNEWCQSQVLYGSGSAKGTPGKPNSPCGVSVCLDESGNPVTVAPLQVGELVISELLPDTPGKEDPLKEWVELYVAAEQPIYINGLKFFTDADAAKPKATVEPEDSHCIIANPGEYLLFTPGTSEECGIPEEKITYTIKKLSLTDSGYLGIRVGGQVIDEYEWNNADDGIALQKDVKGTWCNAVIPYYVFDADTSDPKTALGTPGEVNTTCGVAYCIDNGQWRPVNAVSAGQLVISEYMGNPAGPDTSEKEWFEVYVTPQAAGKDLKGIKILVNGKLEAEVGAFSPDCLTVGQGYLLFAGSNVHSQNGGLPDVDVVLDGVTLPNSNVTLTLSTSDTIIDSVVFEKVPAEASLQLDPFFIDAAANDDPSNWCTAKVPYGEEGNKGTPGQENPSCEATFCTGPNGPEPVTPPYVGALVITEVYANVLGNENENAHKEWFEIYVTPTSGTIDLNGVAIMTQAGGEGNYVFEVEQCIELQPDTYYVLCRDPTAYSAVEFENCIPYAGVTFTSGNPFLALGSTGVIYDMVLSYGVASDGISRSLDPAYLDADLNDESEAWCDTPEGYTFGANPQQRGTPGQPNPPCPE